MQSHASAQSSARSLTTLAQLAVVAALTASSVLLFGACAEPTDDDIVESQQLDQLKEAA